jgi:tetratricopeptide (TPR) repeat protein
MRITKSTLAYLDGLAKDAGNNQDVRSTLGKAYLATGDIQGYPDDPNLGDSAGALSSYAEAVKLFGPGDRIPRGRLYWHRGVVLFKLGRVPEGVASLKKALDETEPLDTHDSLLVAAGALHSLAYALTPSNPEEALADARREMQIYSKLASGEPGNLDFQNGLAQSYFTIGGALIRRNRIEEALDLYRASAGILESLVAKHPNDYLVGRDLLNAYARIGDVLGNPARRNLGDSRGALAVYQKAIAIANTHIAADPNDHLAQMDRMELLWRIGVTMENPDETGASLKILDEAHTAASPKPGSTATTAQIRALALIDQFRGKRLVHANDGNGAVAAYKRSIEQAQLLIKKDPTDSSGWTIGLVAYSGLTPALAGLGRREEAIRLARQAIEEANQVLTSGSDKVALAIYVPRTAMWLAQTYEALAQKGASNQQRREDYLSAAENYANAAAEWQKLHSRADFVRFQSEAADCAKKSAECRRKAG